VLTALSITVILFAQLGMLVKSIAVPDVLATAVPNVSGCDNFAGVIDASAIVKLEVETVVTLPLASTESVGIIPDAP